MSASTSTSSSTSTLPSTLASASTLPSSTSPPSQQLALLSATPLRVGCIGGGQLGLMMALEAPRLNIQMTFLDPMGDVCPAAAAVGGGSSSSSASSSYSNSNSNRIVQASLQDAEQIRQLAKQVQVLTVEIEHVNVEALAQVEAEGLVRVQPSSRVLSIIQDKYLQKMHFSNSSSCSSGTSSTIPLPPFMSTSSVQEIQQAAKTLGLPLMLKSRKGGYDGRGNAVLRKAYPESILHALKELGVPEYQQQLVDGTTGSATSSNSSPDGTPPPPPLDLYAEGWVDFECEISVMVVRSAATATATVTPASSCANDETTQRQIQTRCYPAVNAIQQNSVCRVVLAPAINLSKKVRLQAEQLAMRAIDALGPGASGVFGVEMFLVKNKNEVGDEDGEPVVLLVNEVAPRPHNTGHYTQDACTCSQFENHLRGICGLPLGSTDMIVNAAAMVNVLGTGNATTTLASCNAALQHMPRAAVHWYSKAEDCRLGRKMGHVTLTGRSHSELRPYLNELLELEGIPLSLLPRGTLEEEEEQQQQQEDAKNKPLVGVIMGSHSDLPTMQAAVDILRQFDIPHEVDIVSAHRTPDKLLQYSRSAAARGIRVIIAGAGGAAHLPGMVAAMTPLPVVGVPVKTSTLSGVDSLYSIVQMPRGVPVATVAIGNAANAGLLAVRILSTSNSELLVKMSEYQDGMRDAVHETSAQLQQLGSDAFLAQMDSKSKSVNV